MAYSTNLTVPSYTSVTDIVSVTPPGATAGESEDTQLQSAAKFKEFSGGWFTAGDFEFETYFVIAQDAALVGLQGTMLAWRVTYPKTSAQSSTGTTFTFHGFIKDWKPGQGQVGSDDKYKTTWTVKVSGPVTGAPGS